MISLFSFPPWIIIVVVSFSQNMTSRKIHESFPGNALTFSMLVSACLRISIYKQFWHFLRRVCRSFCLCMSNTYNPITNPVDVVTGSAKGADIVLEAVVEAEVARSAKDFFSQPQSQIQ
jgi:hypothetical protein